MIRFESRLRLQGRLPRPLTFKNKLSLTPGDLAYILVNLWRSNLNCDDRLFWFCFWFSVSLYGNKRSCDPSWQRAPRFVFAITAAIERNSEPLRHVTVIGTISEHDRFDAIVAVKRKLSLMALYQCVDKFLTRCLTKTVNHGYKLV